VLETILNAAVITIICRYVLADQELNPDPKLELSTTGKWAIL